MSGRAGAFWSLVDRRSSGECWLWLGSKHPRGYGSFSLGRGRHVRAHRFAYELLVGPIPDGLVVDHLCRNTSCVNPAHLEAVTQRTNVLRGVGPSAVNATKTHCKRGHLFTPANTYVAASGKRFCRACKRIGARKAVA